jgi:hypothetical protein
LVIAPSREDVFGYIADALSDPEWCPKVVALRQIEGDGPGPGSRYV